LIFLQKQCFLIASSMSSVISVKLGVFHSSGNLMLSRFKSG
jgi:hypothetical protein